MRWSCLAITVVFFAVCSEARIATPSFPSLAQRSSSIATGKVLLVLPTPLSPVMLLAAAGLFASVVFISAWRPGRKHRAAMLGVLTFLVALVGIVVIMSATTFTGYHNVAFVRVERAHRGSIHGIVPVFFRTSFVCDISAMESGERYVLFLNPGAIGYQPSWYDWSIWQISNGRVQTQRLAWSGVKDTVYDTFVSSIPEALAQREMARLPR